MGEGGGVFTQSSILKKLFNLLEIGVECWCDTGCDNTCKRFKWKLTTIRL